MGEQAKDGAPVPPDHDESVATEFGAEILTRHRISPVFNAPVYIEHGTIGASHGGTEVPQGTRDRPPLTGRVDEQLVTGVQRTYAPPAGYHAARVELSNGHIVVLAGRSGAGRRAGALCLLRDCTDGPLETLSPALSLTELGTQPYRRGHGYLADIRDGSESARNDFGWTVLRDRVRAADAHLVVIGEPGTIGRVDPVPAIEWQPPDLRFFLRRSSALDEPSVERVLECAGEPGTARFGMQVWKQVIAGIEAGAEPGEVIVEQEKSVACERVRAWFDERCSSLDALAEITALLFLAGCGLRQFEELSGRLGDLLRVRLLGPLAEDTVPHDPAAGAEPGAVDGPPRQHRLVRIADGGLITVVPGRVGAAGSTDVAEGQIVQFREAADRGYTAAELWARWDSRFWDGVREWLNEIAAESADLPGPTVSCLADGVVAMAAVAPTEVRWSFLEPWSTGYSLMRTQSMAAEVLMAMSRDDAQAPVALRIATQWVASGVWRAQWSATLAFALDLGTRYPVEAVDRLEILLISGTTALRGFPGNALGALFEQLSGEPAAASRVLRMLAGRIRECPPGRPERDRVLAAVRIILGITRMYPEHSAVFVVHCADHAYADILGELWAALLRYRPQRAESLDLLIDAVPTVAAVAVDPADSCAVFADALAATLRDSERRALRRDLESRLRRRRGRAPADADIEPLYAVLTTRLTQPSLSGVPA